MAEMNIYPRKCACCNESMISEKHEICPVCGWEDDRVQNEDPLFKGGANTLSLEEYREAFFKKREEQFNDSEKFEEE